MNKYYGLKPGTVTKQELEHTDIVRDIAARGMVLLEHDGTLPLEKNSKIALYGFGAKNTIFCGLGAASFTSREEVTIEEGLERAGITVTSKAYLERYAAAIQAEEDAYYSIMRDAAKDALIDGVVKMYGEPFVPGPQPIITESDLRDAAEAELAVFVISRVSGEGADRKNAAGDYLLSAEEKENLRILSENFRKVIVLLNTGGQIDTSYIRLLPNLGAMVFVGQAAGVTGLAVADVLTGKIVPEGRLVDTWAEKYEDYPNAENFAAMNGNLDDEVYSEGIYVGYRYFDSFGITPAYPFGYGLSYTDFSICTENVYKEKGKIVVEATVTNIGDFYEGREVVQVYVSAPGGEIEKAYQELKGFEKSDVLKAGETQKIKITVDIRSLACYSVKKAAWILEAGDYLVRVGNSSRNTCVAAVLRVKEEILCEQCRNLCTPDWKIEEMSVKNADRYCTGRDTKEVSSAKVLDIGKEDVDEIYVRYRTPLWEQADREWKESINPGNNVYPDSDVQYPLRFEDVLNGKTGLDSFVDSLTAEEMSYLCVGNAGEDDATFVTYGSGNTKTDAVVPMAPGTCDTTRNLIQSRGIPNMHMSDGGSGLRLLPQFEVDKEGNLLTEGVLSVRNVDKIIGKDYITDRVHHSVYEQYTTGLPMATMLAQTWDRECWRKCGEIEGKEMQRFHVELWLAPSMNIHRNPLCGRNFEYYSEDPVITGECASAVIKAIQSFRFAGVTIKHFACNNQEDNRHATNVHISERALREIYLKGYEIAVKKANPTAMMTSYNLINGTHTANHYELLTSIARDEWGFDGMIMTDWGTTSQADNDKHKYKASTCSGCIRAGNDLIMPGSRSDIDALYGAVKVGEVTIEELRLCSKRILKTILRLEAGRV
ncbi:MAG: glycoside hydrolase family 3 N-terminal domain-containing protein [Eubacteriales bacterium]|nr:glycoside hydrolase family 3 N-terminal domain-containing protein [Eubacteriales bacterium]